jgi:hypothetical protein
MSLVREYRGRSMTRGTRLLLQTAVLTASGLGAIYCWALGSFNRFYFPAGPAGNILCDSSVLLIAAGCLSVWLLRRRPPRPGKCTRCGYDLAGNTTGVCPECGTATAGDRA